MFIIPGLLFASHLQIISCDVIDHTHCSYSCLANVNFSQLPAFYIITFYEKKHSVNYPLFLAGAGVTIPSHANALIINAL